MSEFINTINTADHLASSFKAAEIPFLLLQEKLIGLGFYEIRLLPLRAKLNGVEYKFN